MINLSKCNSYADKIDEAAIEVSNMINIYDDAYYYMSQNASNDSETYSALLYNTSLKLKNIKTDLRQISTKIRTQAKHIYNEELAEKQKQEE